MRQQVGDGSFILSFARIAIGFFVVACGPTLPPPGEYKPDPTPEPETKCPAEAKAAKQAREALIGESTSALREAAAKAAFAHGDCERKVLDAMPLDADSEPAWKMGLQELTAQAYTAQNLYLEAVNYDIPRWAVGGNARTGELYTAYADKLRNAEPGPGVTDPSTRALWFQEVASTAADVEVNGAVYYDHALAVAEMGPDAFREDAQIAEWIRVSCRGLARVDRSVASGHPSCAR